MLNPDLEFLKKQREVLTHRAHFPTPKPLTEFETPTESSRIRGQQLLSQGKVACLILAGGQGSRLETALPKALFEITPVRKKTLMQRLCEKTVAASQAYQTALQMAVMTSSSNHELIEDYLIQNRYFGLNKKQIHLFQQDNAPFLDDHGNWITETSGTIVAGPDGNGHSLRKLMQSGIGQQWKEQGIESLIVLPIDNPLADPFDAALCGDHELKSREATLKAIQRLDPTEKVGVIVSRKGRIAVQEYSELPDHFEAPLAHIGLFCFSLSFVEKIAQVELPWHVAHKRYKNQKIWKFERFLFDVLDHTEKAGVLVYPREDVYAPLKNLTGSNSLEKVQQALSAFDQRWIGSLTNRAAPDHLFELDPAFYYVTEEQKKIWSGKVLPALDYYEPLKLNSSTKNI